MNVHITKTYNIGGKTGIMQDSVANAGADLGWKEMSLFRFPDEYDSDEQLHVRMDGIIASLCPGDIVIYQYPSGISARYDRFLLEHIRRYAGVKLVICVQDIAPDRENSGYNIEDEIFLLNQADFLVLPSEKVYSFYQKHGMKDKPWIIQKFFDYMTDVNVLRHEERKIYILSEDVEPGNEIEQSNVVMLPFARYHVAETILKVSSGGFGLVWNFEEEEKWDVSTAGLTLGLFMAAGIPVIVQKGLPCEAYVEEHGVGIVAKNLEEVYTACTVVTEAEFMKYYDNVRKVQHLFISGSYTKRLLMEILISVTEKC